MAEMRKQMKQVTMTEARDRERLWDGLPDKQSPQTHHVMKNEISSLTITSAVELYISVKHTIATKTQLRL